MSVIKTWRVHSIAYKPELHDLEKVVSAVTWRLDGTDGDHSDSIFGTVHLPEPTGEFVPFDELSEPTVLEWCHAQIGPDQVKGYEAEITTKIQTLANPPVAADELPWALID